MVTSLWKPDNNSIYKFSEFKIFENYYYWSKYQQNYICQKLGQVSQTLLHESNKIFHKGDAQNTVPRSYHKNVIKQNIPLALR